MWALDFKNKHSTSIYFEALILHPHQPHGSIQPVDIYLQILFGLINISPPMFMHPHIFGTIIQPSWKDIFFLTSSLNFSSERTSIHSYNIIIEFKNKKCLRSCHTIIYSCPKWANPNVNGDSTLNSSKSIYAAIETESQFPVCLLASLVVRLLSCWQNLLSVDCYGHFFFCRLLRACDDTQFSSGTEFQFDFIKLKFLLYSLNLIVTIFKGNTKW